MLAANQGSDRMNKVVCTATALLMGVVALALPAGAGADGVYHSQHLALEPVGNAPLRSGFVENTHANGPTVYAQEMYGLNGASPDTTYEVHLLAYPLHPDCSGAASDFGSVPLTTNVAGNGTTRRVFRPADVPAAIRGATHGIRWEVRLGGTTVYATACTAVTLD